MMDEQQKIVNQAMLKAASAGTLWLAISATCFTLIYIIIALPFLAVLMFILYACGGWMLALLPLLPAFLLAIYCFKR